MKVTCSLTCCLPVPEKKKISTWLITTTCFVINSQAQFQSILQTRAVSFFLFFFLMKTNTVIYNWLQHNTIYDAAQLKFIYYITDCWTMNTAWADESKFLQNSGNQLKINEQNHHSTHYIKNIALQLSIQLSTEVYRAKGRIFINHSLISMQ